MSSSWKLSLTLRLLSALVAASPLPLLADDATSLESALHRIDQLESQVKDLARYGYGVPVESEACCPSVETSSLVCPAWEASVDFLYLKLHQRGLDYAVSDNGSALTLGGGDVHNLDYDRDAGIRMMLGYRTRTNWAIRLGYTNFDTDGVAFAQRPDGIGQLFATRSQPDGAEESDTARAAAGFDYQLFDLIAERPVFVNRFSSFNIFGGLRWIDMQQHLQYEYDGRDFANGRIVDHTRMDGMGLRMGGEGRWRMFGGLSAFGSLAGCLTYGRFETRFFEDNLDQTIVVTDLRDRFDDAVASLDARAGLSYSWTHLTISAGYEMIDWFNLAERAIFVDDIQEATYVPLSQDVLLEGLFFQVAVTR